MNLRHYRLSVSDSANITATGDGFGLRINGDATISNSTVEARSSKNTGFLGKNIEIIDGANVRVASSSDIGINCYGGEISFVGSTVTVTAEGQNGIINYSGGAININGSTVTVTSAGQSYSASVYGIYTSGNINISGDAVTVTASAENENGGAFNKAPATFPNPYMATWSENADGSGFETGNSYTYSDTHKYVKIIEGSTIPVTGVTLDTAQLSLNVGATATLTATVEPLDATNQNVTWSSSAPAVATVDETTGLITAVTTGTATITATTEDGGFTATCEVTVTQPVTGVTLNETELSLAIGETATLTATVEPADATNQNVTWSSSNDAVATVDETGLVTAVTAVTAGAATITVTTEDGGFTATCEVTVTQPVTGVTLNETQLSLEIGETATLTATVEPADATNQNVTWSSSNDAVATVDETGLVTAVTAGTATITVTTDDGGFTATCEVTVTQPVTGVTLNETELSLAIGATATLTATVLPLDATNKAVTFGSSNNAVATVSATGLVTAVTAGTATITVTTQEGGFTATCEVTVTGGSGIDDNTLTDITVYGNGNSVYIVNKNSVNLKSVQITDVLGRVVYNGKGTINRTRTEEIPVNGASGIYIVRLLSDDNKTLSTKVHLTR